MWDEEDGFFYDVLRAAGRPAPSASRCARWSGCLPLCAVDRRSRADVAAKVPRDSRTRLRRLPRARARSSARSSTHPSNRASAGRAPARSILNETKLRRVLARMLDENEFLEPVRHPRALAAPHGAPVRARRRTAQEYRVDYLPGESNSGMFGGNSNWRGPVWMPVNVLIIRALLQFYAYYGDDFTIECPTGSGRQMTLFEVAEELAGRLASIFLRDANGRARSTAAPRSSRTIRTGATSSSSTSTSTATTAPASAPATRPAGPASSRGFMQLFATRRPRRCSSSARPP